MNIVVLVKHVPDSSSDRRFNEDLTTDRAGVDGLLSELDEYAAEQALRITEEQGGTVTYVTMGPAAAAEALRKALSMGGDAGVHVSDENLHGSDAVATSLVLAEALKKLDWDLVMTGMASTDGWMSVVPAMISECLGVPGLTMASEIAVGDGVVTIRRDTDEASTTASVKLPAIVSATDQTSEPRYPSFKGIMAAKKKPITTWSLADLGIAADEVGLTGALCNTTGATPRPPRESGTVITDEGDAAIHLADFLTSAKFI